MNIFKSVTFKWWQLKLYKLAVLSLGIVIGSQWPEVFLPYTVHLLTLTVLLGVYLIALWYKQR